jgi:GAF domain-containing protein
MSIGGDELVQVFVNLSRVLLTEVDLRGDLERVVSVAQTTVPGCDGASVTLMVEGRPATEAATDRVVLEADLIQYRNREGPCLSAIATGEPIRVGLLSADQRFVRFAAGAGQIGIASMLSLPVSVAGKVVAGLNLYSHSAHGFDQSSETVGSVLAAQAGVAVAKSEALAASQRAADRLQRDLDDQADIRRGEGILMVLHECGAEQAAALLRSAATSDHQTVTAVARRLAVEARSAQHRADGAGRGLWSAASQDHASVSELLGVYALEGCDEDETTAIEAHISECSDCALEAVRLKQVAGWLGVSQAATPMDDLRRRLLRKADPGEA